MIPPKMLDASHEASIFVTNIHGMTTGLEARKKRNVDLPWLVVPIWLKLGSYGSGLCLVFSGHSQNTILSNVFQLLSHGGAWRQINGKLQFRTENWKSFEITWTSSNQAVGLAAQMVVLMFSNGFLRNGVSWKSWSSLGQLWLKAHGSCLKATEAHGSWPKINGRWVSRPRP